LSAADEQLLRELTERARAGGLKLTGEGACSGKLTKMVVEGALEGEMDDHLGYSKHDPAGRNGGNSRNGHRPKTVLTEAGPVEVSVPVTGIPVLSRRSSRKGSGGLPGSRTW
jgi:putative transposase